MIDNTIDLGALCDLQYGLYIVSSFCEEKRNAQIATVVFQVTSEPVQIAVCLAKGTLTYDYVTSSQVFGVSILEESTDMRFIGRFGFHSGRDFDKFQGVQFVTKKTGSPLVVDHALSILEVAVKNTLDIGTHSLFVGELLSAEVLKKGVVLTYDHYLRVKKGKTPENAPTFQSHVGMK